MEEGDKIPQHKLVEYISKQYDSKVEEFEKTQKEELNSLEIELREILESTIASYKEERDEIISREWRRKQAEVIVHQRVTVDTLKENAISNLIENVLEITEVKLQDDEKLAKEYYSNILSNYLPDMVKIIIIDKRFTDLPREICLSFDGEIRPKSSIGIEFHKRDVVEYFSPRHLYKVQNLEIRQFVRKELFR